MRHDRRGFLLTSGATFRLAWGRIDRLSFKQWWFRRHADLGGSAGKPPCAERLGPPPARTNRPAKPNDYEDATQVDDSAGGFGLGHNIGHGRNNSQSGR